MAVRRLARWKSAMTPTTGRGVPPILINFPNASGAFAKPMRWAIVSLISSSLAVSEYMTLRPASNLI